VHLLVYELYRYENARYKDKTLCDSISSVQFKEAEDIYRSQGAFDFRSLGQLEWEFEFRF
jgi:hypothetical protein